MIPVEVTLDRAGRTPFRLTPNITGLRWTTAAVGGFGSCTFNLPGPPPFWKRELPHLSTLRIVLDTFVIWEGRIEDITMSLLDETTQVQCFGNQRLLGLTSIHRIWANRFFTWQNATGGEGGPIPFNKAGALNKRAEAVSMSTGAFDPGDLTKTGLRFAGNGVALATTGDGLMAWAFLGVTIQQLLGTVTLTGANTGALKFAARIFAWTYGDTSVLGFTNYTATQDFTAAATGDSVGFGAYNANLGALTPTNTDTIDFTNLRVLGLTTTEDATGGYYGGTVLRDLIALVPGLSVGVIDSGSDYTITTIERSVRSAALDVVNEVSSYYSTRDWQVWEDGRFDWKTVNKDEPQWLATINDLDSGSELTATSDGLAKTLYVIYVDAATTLPAEASATSTSQRNPFVKQGQTSDVLVNPGFAMTSSTSAQLASTLVTDQGGYPVVQGRLMLPATRVIKRASGSPLPAFMIRAGDNIVVSDLPKTDLFQTGRDGETLFHIISTEASLDDGSMTLEVEGQTRRSDVLLARLAAATRGVTG